MRFITLVKSAETMGRPPQALLDAVAWAGEEATRAGTLIEVGGLAPTALGSRVRLSGGELTITDGPFTEAKEVIGGYAVHQLNSRAEAVEAAVWLMNLHKELWPGWEGEVEIRQMFEPEDFAADAATP